jgi:enediyne biosynthesis protein E4
MRIAPLDYYARQQLRYARLCIHMRVQVLGIALLLWVAVLGGAQVHPKASRQTPDHPYPANTSHPAPAWFVNVAPQAGLTMQNVNGDTKTKKYIIETTGSGVAIIDYDHDGWPDIFLLNGETLVGEPSPVKIPTSHLYHNNRDGTFTDVTAGSGLETPGWAQGVCVGDYDNDGYDDLYVTYYGKSRLYRNLGNGRFKDIAEQAGVAGDGTKWGTGCAFIDYDRDGKLDLVVANYVQFNMKTIPKPGEGVTCIWKGVPVMCGPRGLPYTTNLLYHSLGNGRFADVSKASGIMNTAAHYCFSASTLDYNMDGWPDIFIACDSTPSILYRNNKDGTFKDVADDANVSYAEDGHEQAGMGSTVGDYDNDGWPDMFKTNFSDDTASLFHNNRDGTFTPVIDSAGLGLNTQYLGWGTMFVDVDNDGWPDLLSVNGHVYPEVDTAELGSTYREPRLLYWNERNGRFKDIGPQSGPGITEPFSSRGLAVADLWNEGRMSAVVNDIDDKPLLLVNLSANTNHWLGVSLQGTKSNRDGIGARVSVFSAGHRWVQEVRSGSSYISSNDLRLHFGLGSSDVVDHIDVLWPSGLKEQFAGSEPDRFVTLAEGTGTRITD